ncbi:MAG: hypothetical protein KC609_23870 [Myxococcales bacterium]|nr:hypothetical protein [Myxococcales bacterium]
MSTRYTSSIGWIWIVFLFFSGVAGCSSRASGTNDQSGSNDAVADVMDDDQLTTVADVHDAQWPDDLSNVDIGTVTPVTGHPRLFITAEDLPRLRSWAQGSNPIYANGLAHVAAEMKNAMDDGHLPSEDNGSAGGWTPYPTEACAMLFALMSQIHPDENTRADYGKRARDLLMYAIGEAAKGVLDDAPFRDPAFSTSNRSRWWGEGFGLTVDWAYAYFSTEDKALIRTVFLRWIDENIHATTTSNNHPEPIGVVNDPSLLTDAERNRWSMNNYYTAHMRNIGLMALSLDPADDPGNELRSALTNATGAWLYVIDHTLRQDTVGGLLPEGFEYSPQSLAYVVQFLFALHTAGEDDPTKSGPQVRIDTNPFWDQALTAYLHSMSPDTRVIYDYIGPVYQPAWYGDGQKYWAPDYIAFFAPLALYDLQRGNTTRAAALRWIQREMAPGGPTKLGDRIGSSDDILGSILYFLLYDPAAPTPSDPRPQMPTDHFAAGLGRVLSRTDWSKAASWFTFKLSWNSVDHQHGDGNMIELYRNGEWLTKDRTGYGMIIAQSDYKNTLTIQNDKPDRGENDYRYQNWLVGSQWLYVSDEGAQVLRHSLHTDYVYALGDSTALYNSTYESCTDVVHASRSVVWLKPDVIVLYDRAETKSDGRFKRFWLNLPEIATVKGTLTSMKTASGQQLFLTTLLPSDPTIVAETTDLLEATDEPAEGSLMRYRVMVEAPGNPKVARFLHVLQGADSGVSPLPTSRIESDGGTPFAGVRIGGPTPTAVLFPVTIGAVEKVSYVVAADTARQLVTGLDPTQAYSVTTSSESDGLHVLIVPASNGPKPDAGGVLLVTP